MTKKEQYVRNIQQMAIDTHYPFDFLSNVKVWSSTQTILKHPLFKRDEVFIGIWFVEYVNHRLEEDYHNRQNIDLDLYTYLYNKVSCVCLTHKAISTDNVMSMVLDACKDKLGRIKHEDWDKKVDRRKELYRELNQLNMEMSL